jgi:hypothetical protein
MFLFFWWKNNREKKTKLKKNEKIFFWWKYNSKSFEKKNPIPKKAQIS